MITINDTTFIIRSNNDFNSPLNYTLGTIYYDKWGKKTDADVRILRYWNEIHKLKNLKKYLFIANEGLLFLDIQNFFNELSKVPKNIGYGHIINYKPNEYYLHEASILLESNKLPSTFGTDTLIEFPKLKRSLENVHDSHTPLYVQKHEECIYFSQKQLFGQDIIKKYVEEKGIFLNFSNICRQYKIYLYDQKNYNFEKYFSEYKKNCEQTLWIYNNTPFKEIKSDRVALVASGLAWVVQLLKNNSAAIDLYDISSVQLKFAEELLKKWQGINYGEFVYNFLRNNKIRTWIMPCTKFNLAVSALDIHKNNLKLIKNKETFINLINEKFNIFLNTHFNSLNFIQMWKNKNIKNVNFFNKDIFEEYRNYKPNAIWATNITSFKYNFLKHTHTSFKNFEKYIKINIDTPTLYFTKKMSKFQKNLKKKILYNISDIVNNSGLPCLKLDIDIPYENIFEEIKKIEHFFVTHRSSESQGWQSFCIHGKSYDSTEQTTDLHDNRPYIWTKEAESLLPFTVDYFKNKFPYDHYERLRIMKLLPGGFIKMHKDYKLPRLSPINIAINNPTKNKFYLEKWGVVDFEPGDAYMLDLSNYHCVYNESNEDRYHIIVHGKINKKMENIITNSYQKLKL